MTVLDRYLIREYIKPLGYTFLAGILIFLTAELFENIDILIDNKVPLSTAISFFIYELPMIIIEILPIICLIATQLTFSRLSRQNELVIFKVSGMNTVRTIAPILFFSFFISIGALIFNETVVPISNANFKEIKNQKIYKRTFMSDEIKQNVSYYDESGKMYFIKQIDPNRGVINGFTIYEFDQNFELIKRYDAPSAKWLGKYWILENGFLRTFDEKEKAESFKAAKVPVKETPSDFVRKQKDPMEMSFFDLREYVRKMKNSGLAFKKEIIELYTKISYPFTSFFIVLLGIPFALKTGRKGTFILSVGLSLLFGFIYWGVIALFKALGRSDVLDPMVSAWGANILFGSLSLIMLKWTDK
ncbi:MAG: LPS export ABC transporter permease LptG [bacterium]|nr:LPS export ABC transporter permease LptG [bacterium]